MMQIARAVKVESENGPEKLRAVLAHHGQPFPHQLAARFPHVVKRILALWQAPDKARTYFKNLLAKGNAGVQGFPPDVYQEIFILASFYDEQYPALTNRRDIWAGFSN